MRRRMTLNHCRMRREEKEVGLGDTGGDIIHGEEDDKQCFEQDDFANHHRKGNKELWRWQQRESDGMMGYTSNQVVDGDKESRDDRRHGEWQIAIQST